MGELGRDLAEALALSIGGSDTAPITPMRIAKMMAKNVGKVVDGMRIAIRRDRKRKMDRYVVEVVDAQASDSGPGAPPGPV